MRKHCLLHLGCEVYLNQEEEKVQKHPLVLCIWLLLLKQEYEKCEHKLPANSIHLWLSAAPSVLWQTCNIRSLFSSL